MKDFERERANEVDINVQELLLFYLKKWWVIVLCVGLAGALTLVYTIFYVTPLYQAGVTIYVNNRVTEEKDQVTSADLSASVHLVKAYTTITKSDYILEKVSERLDNEYSAAAIRGMISTEQINTAEIFAVYIVNKSPQEAARIADMVGEVVTQEGQNVILGSAAKVIDWAKVPTYRYSPSYSRNAILGGMVGLLLAIVYLTIHHLKDNRIKDENDLTDMFQLPILGRIPDLEYAGEHQSQKTE